MAERQPTLSINPGKNSTFLSAVSLFLPSWSVDRFCVVGGEQSTSERAGRASSKVQHALFMTRFFSFFLARHLRMDATKRSAGGGEWQIRWGWMQMQGNQAQEPSDFHCQESVGNRRG